MASNSMELLGKNVRPARSEHYHYNNGDTRVQVQYAPVFEGEEFQRAFPHAVRVLIYCDPKFMDGDLLPNPEWQKRMSGMEDKLMKMLDKPWLNVKWAGTLRYEGSQDSIFLTDNPEDFSKIYNDWYPKQKAYRIRIAFQSNLDQVFDLLLPQGPLRRQISDRYLIEQLKSQKTNQEAKHWLLLKFSGAAERLKDLQEDLEKRDIYLKSMPKGGGEEPLVLTVARELKLDPIGELTQLCDERAEYHQVRFLGWNAATVKAQTLEGNIKDGFGIYIWDNGLIYEGDWVKGKRNGKGRMYFADGTWYLGDFKDDKRTGKGTMYWNHNEWYRGDFDKGQLHGKGEYRWDTGAHYDGDWLDGVRTGKGVYQWKSGDVYRGDYLNDYRHGKGRIDYKDGGWFEGDFVKGKMTGYGREYVPSKNHIVEGTLVDGTWQDDKKVTSLDPPEESKAETGAAPSELSTDAQGGAAPGGRAGSSDEPLPVGQSASTAAPSETSNVPTFLWTEVAPDQDHPILFLQKTAREAREMGFTPFVFFNATWGEEFDFKKMMGNPGMADAFEGTAIIEFDERHKEALDAFGVPTFRVPALVALDEKSYRPARQWTGLMSQEGEALARSIRGFFFPTGDNAHSEPVQVPEVTIHKWVSIPDDAPQSLQEILKEQADMAKASGLRPFLFISEPWAPGAAAFEKFRSQAEMEAILKGTLILQMGLKWLEEVNAMGHKAYLVPEFFEFNYEGELTGNRKDGGSWGADTLENIVGAMQSFFHEA